VGGCQEREAKGRTKEEEVVNHHESGHERRKDRRKTRGKKENLHAKSAEKRKRKRAEYLPQKGLNKTPPKKKRFGEGKIRNDSREIKTARSARRRTKKPLE